VFVTLTSKLAAADSTAALPSGLSDDRIEEYLSAYVANPLYRSARFSELVIDDNPYRRPVRPEDLSFLRFDRPLTRANSSQLSSLIGHRILLNVYDTSRPLLAKVMTEERWQDFKLFYGERNRVLGEVIRPFLEHHVFSFVEQAVAEMGSDGAPGSTSAVRAALESVAARRQRQASGLLDLVRVAGRPREAAKMVAVQLLASMLNAPLRLSSTMVRRSLDGESAVELQLRRETGHVDGVLAELMQACGFDSRPHQYYQFYLPSTLALMNYINATSRDHGRIFRFLGAMCARTLDSVALIGVNGNRLAELAGDTSASPADHGTGQRAVAEQAAERPGALEPAIHSIVETAVVPLAQRLGEEALQEFGRGLHEYALLLDVHHDDLSTQLRWIDSAAACVQKAHRLHEAITRYRIPVQLDTFVESWEECSTTHVHDEDRLLVIERGEMEFWNCFAGTHKFSAGDKMFIPKHRLHGSVVLSGECVYHQPVITAEIDNNYG
jgi:hypothetical protein